MNTTTQKIESLRDEQAELEQRLQGIPDGRENDEEREAIGDRLNEIAALEKTTQVVTSKRFAMIETEEETEDDETAFAWWVKAIGIEEPLAGGYCRTEDEAFSDAKVWMADHSFELIFDEVPEMCPSCSAMHAMKTAVDVTVYDGGSIEFTECVSNDPFQSPDENCIRCYCAECSEYIWMTEDVLESIARNAERR